MDAIDLGALEDYPTAAEPYCRWPGCLEPAAVSVDGGEAWDCWDHLTDDFLPPVVGGTLGRCQHCRTSCVQWITDAHGSTCLHAHCRRPWFYAIAADGIADVQARAELAEQEAAGVVIERKGAYGRRQRGEA